MCEILYKTLMYFVPRAGPAPHHAIEVGIMDPHHGIAAMDSYEASPDRYIYIYILHIALSIDLPYTHILTLVSSSSLHNYIETNDTKNFLG